MNDLTAIRSNRFYSVDLSDNKPETTATAKGRLGEHTISNPGGAEPRAGTSALKTFGLAVQHFFSSLFGISIKAPAPKNIETEAHAAQAAVAELTRRNCDPLTVLSALDDVAYIGNHAATSEDIRDGVSKLDESGRYPVDNLFREELSKLDDVQLYRARDNLAKHHELGTVLVQLTQELIGNPDQLTERELMQRGGEIDEGANAARGAPLLAIGNLASQLSEVVDSILSERGYKLDPGSADQRAHEPSAEITEIARRVVTTDTASVRDEVAAIHAERNRQAEARAAQMMKTLDEMLV